MHKVLLFIPLIGLAIAPAAIAQDTSAQHSDGRSVSTDVRLADGRATRLRARARFPDWFSDAQVRVLISWGSGVDYETSIAAYREGVAHWRIERVYNGGNINAYSRGMVTATTSYLSAEAGAKLDALLRNPALYDEPAYTWGYTVPEGATISIRFENRTHDAVFSGMLSGASLTGRVIDIVDENNSPRLRPEGKR
ncbi:MAG TPA: hypothetical protein VGL66_05400 [Caulobacteraceae bacterium]|jgi:hypothetical protein